MVVFTNGPVDWGSMPSWVIPNTQKMALDTSLLNTQHYKVHLIPPCLTLSIISYVSRVKWSNPGKEETPSLTPRCCSYWKGSFSSNPQLRSPSLLTYFKQFTFFVYSQLNVKNNWYKTIQFWEITHCISILPIDRALSGATILGQSGSGSDDIKGVLFITAASPSNCLVLYPGHS